MTTYTPLPCNRCGCGLYLEPEGSSVHKSMQDCIDLLKVNIKAQRAHERELEEKNAFLESDVSSLRREIQQKNNEIERIKKLLKEVQTENMEFRRKKVAIQRGGE